MKTVINNTATEVSSDAVSDQKYYGVLVESKQKGFILRKNYKTENFRAVCSEALTEGNAFCLFDETNSLSSFVKGVLRKKGKVFEFDTEKELFLWLAE